jgi:predicted aspartyl protease
MDGNHVIVMCTLPFNSKEIPTQTLIDWGATGYAFVHQDFADHHELPRNPLKPACTIHVMDGQNISSGDMIHIAQVHLSIYEHRKILHTFVTKLGHYPIVLGMIWLNQHDTAICIALNLVTFGCQYYLAHYNNRGVTVQWTSEEPPEPLCANAAWLTIPIIGAVL